MDNHSIRAGWPFDRQVDFPLGEKMQARSRCCRGRERPGRIPRRRDHGPRRTDGRLETHGLGKREQYSQQPDGPGLDGVSPPEARQGS